MSTRKIRAAVVGCGMISPVYLASIAEHFSILEVVACSDLDPIRMENMAAQFHLKAMSFEDILQDPEIDMILNLTNPVAHYSISSRALKAGKHVWSEKMMAVELAEGKELVSLAQEHHVRLGVAPDTFLGAGLQTARYIIDRGLIGKPLSFQASLSRDFGVFGEILPHLTKKGGGILFDMGGYYLTAMASLFGPVRDVTAFTNIHEPQRSISRTDNDCARFGQPYTLEDVNVLTAALRYDNGVIGTLHMNSDCIIDETYHLIIYGSEGILYLPDPNTFGGELRVRKAGGQEFIFPLTHGYAEESRGLGAAEMAWSIANERPHRANMYMAYNVLETAHAIVTSSQKGQCIRLESTFQQPQPLPIGFIPTGDAFSPTPESALAK